MAALVVVGAIILISVSGGSSGESIPDDLTQFIDTEIVQGAPGFSIGDPGAPVVLVDYSDFSCGACSTLADVLEEIIVDPDGYVQSGELRIVYKPVWFVNPPRSEPASRAAYCAAEQDLFWQYHTEICNLFASGGTNAYTEPVLTSRADRVDGLDLGQFESCLSAPTTQQAVQAVVDEATAIGGRSTPTVFVNGQQVQLTQPLSASIETAIESALSTP
ncbi:MAG: DsbA family protein [Anaerolineae bacterium]